MHGLNHFNIQNFFFTERMESTIRSIILADAHGNDSLREQYMAHQKNLVSAGSRA